MINEKKTQTNWLMKNAKKKYYKWTYRNQVVFWLFQRRGKMKYVYCMYKYEIEVTRFVTNYQHVLMSPFIFLISFFLLIFFFSFLLNVRFSKSFFKFFYCFEQKAKSHAVSVLNLKRNHRFREPTGLPLPHNQWRS